MEDNVYIGAARPRALQRQIVEKAVGILHAVGREIASPAEARQILGLRARA